MESQGKYLGVKFVYFISTQSIANIIIASETMEKVMHTHKCYTTKCLESWYNTVKKCASTFDLTILLLFRKRLFMHHKKLL